MVRGGGDRGGGGVKGTGRAASNVPVWWPGRGGKTRELVGGERVSTVGRGGMSGGICVLIDSGAQGGAGGRGTGMGRKGGRGGVWEMDGNQLNILLALTVSAILLI